MAAYHLHFGQIFTADNMLMECTVLQESHDGYYTVDWLKIPFKTIPEACILGFLRGAEIFTYGWPDFDMVRYLLQFSK